MLFRCPVETSFCSANRERMDSNGQAVDHFRLPNRISHSGVEHNEPRDGMFVCCVRYYKSERWRFPRVSLLSPLRKMTLWHFRRTKHHSCCSSPTCICHCSLSYSAGIVILRSVSCSDWSVLLCYTRNSISESTMLRVYSYQLSFIARNQHTGHYVTPVSAVPASRIQPKISSPPLLTSFPNS